MHKHITRRFCLYHVKEMPSKNSARYIPKSNMISCEIHWITGEIHVITCDFGTCDEEFLKRSEIYFA